MRIIKSGKYMRFRGTCPECECEFVCHRSNIAIVNEIALQPGKTGPTEVLEAYLPFCPERGCKAQKIPVTMESSYVPTGEENGDQPKS